MKSIWERMLSVALSVLMVVTQANVTVLANEAETIDTETSEEVEQETIGEETIDGSETQIKQEQELVVEETEEAEAIDESIEDVQAVDDSETEPEEEVQAITEDETIQGEETEEPVIEDSIETDEPREEVFEQSEILESSEQITEDEKEEDSAEAASTDQNTESDNIVIIEGSYSHYLDAGRRITYSFTPSESGIYEFYSNVEQSCSSRLYDSNNNGYSTHNGYPNFKRVEKLDVGVTYYYVVEWLDSSISGNMAVTLRKYEPIVIDEGAYSCFIGAKEQVIYSFTPVETGLYEFCCDASLSCIIEWYDSNYKRLYPPSYSENRIVSSLEAGETYYYEARWMSLTASGDLNVTLQKYEPVPVVEGMHKLKNDRTKLLEFSFTPSESGIYGFYTNGNYQASLFDANHQERKSDYRDYSGKLIASLEAGKTYYYEFYLNDRYGPVFGTDVTLRIWKKGEPIVIGEGKYTCFLNEGEEVIYSFTPTESGIYDFYSNVTQYCVLGLYDLNYRQVNFTSRNNNKIEANLDAGTTYLLDAMWVDATMSGDMKVTLRKRGSIPITEGTHTFFLDVNEKITYSFTPSESGEYEFYGNYNDAGYIKLYDSNDQLLSSSDYNQFRIEANLEEGSTYYYEVGWHDYRTSGDMKVTLQKHEPIPIAEGTRNIYLDVNEKVTYSFTPSESGEYEFYGNTLSNNYCFVELYDSNNQCLDSVSTYNSFRLVTNLEAGDTYYYVVKWERSKSSGNMKVTLRKHELISIDEGTYSIQCDESKTVQLWFTPSQNGIYELHSIDAYAISLYDSNDQLLKSENGMGSNSKMIANLETGRTYYYMVRGDSNVSDNLRVTLRKYESIFVAEGNYSSYSEAGQTIVYSFTPDESGSYVFYGNGGNYRSATLYDSENQQLKRGYTYENYDFSIVERLEAGRNYYYEVTAYNSAMSCNLKIGLRKYEPILIAEGTYSVQLGANEIATYSFTPSESGIYDFYSNIDQAGDAVLYDSNNYRQGKKTAFSDFRIVAQLEAGSTYYYDVRWQDSEASGEMNVTLKKCNPIAISEGTYSIHLGANERAVCSFTPTENGLYELYGKSNSFFRLGVSYSDYYSLSSGLSSTDFRLAEELEAGRTYYYNVLWHDSKNSGDINFILRKCDAVVITEGTYSRYLDANEIIKYSFTPTESGLYEFYSNVDQHCEGKLYGLNYGHTSWEYGNPNFRQVARLDAGVTYSYQVKWQDPRTTGNMKVTLKKCNLIPISEGTYTNHLDANKKIYYSFTPTESGRYVFYSNVKHSCYVKLHSMRINEYESYRSYSGSPNCWVEVDFEAGKTYYFEVYWLDSNVSADVTMTLKKYRPVAVTEGTYSGHLGPNEKAVFSFTPTESGLYNGQFTLSKIGYSALYDSNHSSVGKPYTPNTSDGGPSYDEEAELDGNNVDAYTARRHLMRAAYLEAGKTYYYEARLSDSTASADMVFTLMKLNLIANTEGTYTTHLEANENAIFSFIPTESGTYEIFSNVDQDICLEMVYPYSYGQQKSPYFGYPNFRAEIDLLAWNTYYFDSWFSDLDVSGDLEITVRKKRDPILITEGTYTSHLGANETVEYSFMPIESGTYEFTICADQLGQVEIFDVSNKPLSNSSSYSSDSRNETYLEAGFRYNYKVRWHDSGFSGDMKVTLRKKNEPIVITEGTYASHLDASESVTYSFSPTESGLYEFFSNVDQDSEAVLYEYGYQNTMLRSGHSDFSLVKKLVAGQTYYYNAWWHDSTASGDMNVTLRKYRPIEMNQGTNAIHLETSDNVTYSFSPTESGLYEFRCNSDCFRNAYLYDSDYDCLGSLPGRDNFRFVKKLDAGRTYYFEALLEDISVSDDASITLEKIEPMQITEGQHILHVNANEKQIFSFVPSKNVNYVMYNKANHIGRVRLYDAKYQFMRSCLYSNSDNCRWFHLYAGETYYYEFSWKDGEVSGDMEIILQEDSPLSITKEPDNVYVEAGKKATATVEVAGKDLTYQWYIKNASASKFSKSSVTKPTYSVTMSDLVNGRQAYCAITDLYGSTVETRVITFYQTMPLSIVEEPRDVKVENGKTASVTVIAAGEGLTYQWYVKNRTETEFSKSFVKNDTYSVTMSDSVDGRMVYCVVRDKYGRSITTDIVKLSKYVFRIATQPMDATAANGEKVAVSVKAEGEGLIYQWYIKSKTASKFSKSSVTKSTYSVTMSDSVDGRQLYCVVTDKNGNKVTSDTVTLHKYVLAITTQPQDYSVPNGSKAIISVEAKGEGLTYQWYIKARTATKFTKSSVAKSTYSVTMSDSVDGRQLYCVVTDKYGSSVTSDTVTLRKYVLAITSQPKDCIVPEGSKATATLKAVGKGLTYQWYIKNASASKFSKSSVTQATYSTTMSTNANGRQIYCKVSDSYGNFVVSDTVTLRMATKLKITTQPEDAYAANGAKAIATVVAEGDGLTYQWYIKNASASKFAKSSVTKATYSVTMSDSVNGRKAYCVVSDTYGNNAVSDTITFHKAKELKIVTQPTDAYAEIGGNAKVTVVAEGDGLTYQWYVKSPKSATFNKSSITKPVYSVTMTESRDGTQLYCVIYDRYGNMKSTRVVMIMVQ